MYTRIFDDLFDRLKFRYLDVLFLATRLSGSVGGALVVYYVNLTVTLQEPTLTRFIIACATVVVIAVILSLICAYYETRHLRTALQLLGEGKKPDPDTLLKAGAEAVTFPARHHWNESWLVPCSTLIPVLVILTFFEQVPV